MTATPKIKHNLQCNDAPASKGVRVERRWSCTCGEARYFGYDSAVKAQHRDHRASVKP